MKKKYFVLILLIIICSLAAIIKINTLPGYIYKHNLQSIVELKAAFEKYGTSYGTAVFVRDDGTLITNAHIVIHKTSATEIIADNLSIRFSDSDEYTDVELIKYDIEKDLAVLKYKGNEQYKSIKIGKSDKLNYGDKIYAIGNGSNYGLSLTIGNISNPQINIEYEGNIRCTIQCDLTIASGNSGGALLDKYGRIIGITTFRLKDSSGTPVYGIAYSIPIEEVVRYVNTD